MYENTMMLLEKIKNGEDGSKYFPYSSHTLLNLEESAEEAKYIRISERYRIKINKSESIREIAILGIECIAKMTGDKVFERENLKKLNDLQ
ncbi:hypothetical protein SH1V18_15160 [Vallitalea longa]|uniref:Uncharacterized protein n=1 Tax=Vallitalea longa TaxID=2936439 RepID=A0A9W5YAP9_9FIRM|nr:hypothetical protein [Vallitalea longa]GKX29036.1 hypothetical protein SH1V18_15160 [Vallitalea longa]